MTGQIVQHDDGPGRDVPPAANTGVTETAAEAVKAEDRAQHGEQPEKVELWFHDV